MKITLAFAFFLVSYTSLGQLFARPKNIFPDKEFDNICVKKLAEDSLQSTFIIWIKKDVKGHFHQEHTENILVISGKAEMLFNGEKIIIKKGDFLNIPKGTKHAVTKIYSRQALKVLSIQSPYFNGKDRIFTEIQNE